mmetsp:Transcript_5029/g.10892  ORF Transcript_5029/g.10892 Transcript_5029/m.10892 type:complete len:296 (+) Transcript_5029:260-1147(+)|eukprot:CAMPEP_0202894410 /NCGR_PEP_ID=MMETSP1392-20130828/3826_1 /ASSEMBLY_ACC=CAM_ASM_000868 /TAXON_ID=225041 /ORGANISM="Chlamydomonas chlamydogama, Strain SAG 11-48b" /LENGTH=295 /DNA_ID=CAMNT_0049579105 /DNA_START=194 /DNA_END=1081 /DNA_ORIENTATION=-
MAAFQGVWKHCWSLWVDQIHPGSKEFGILFYPIITYWLVSGFYDILDHLKLPALERYRIARKERGRDNGITKIDVVLRVLLQHLFQVILGLIMMVLDPHQCAAKPFRGWGLSISHFILGMFVMDAWQFWIHRWVHVNTFLYKHIHSHHHRLLIPYAYGALYNHPVEAILLDTLGALVSMYATGMSCDVAVWFFCFSTCKTVLDHSGYTFPVNPLHYVFPNNAAYHDVHHDVKYIKKNYSQPYFTIWDIIMGSYMDPEGFHYNPQELSEQSSKDTTASSKAQSQAAALNGKQKKDS